MSILIFKTLMTMDARADTKEPKLWTNGEEHYLLFDQPQTHSGKKHVATNALEGARVKRFNYLVLETMSGDPSDLPEISDEDHNLMSDADSPCHQGDIINGVSQGEKCIDELLNDKGARKKLVVLAKIIAVASTEPGVVLAEVVSVLRG